MEIPGVPETLSRDKVVAFFKDIGIDPNWATGIELKHNGVYAEMFVKGENGGKVITNDEVATHKVFVQFV